jgi:predicted nucleic acid-binding protein
VIFADTSALLALFIAADRHHEEAVRAWDRVRASRQRLWTIDPVLNELWLLVRRRSGNRIADQLLEALLDRGLERELVRSEHYARAWALAREWPDQDFSLTDRLAFAALGQLSRPRAWSYDADFAVIRLGPGRTRALDLVR